MEVVAYSVPGIHCAHCGSAITAEVSKVPGVERVDVDLEEKVVSVRGAGVSDVEVGARSPRPATTWPLEEG